MKHCVAQNEVQQCSLPYLNIPYIVKIGPTVLLLLKNCPNQKHYGGGNLPSPQIKSL